MARKEKKYHYIYKITCNVTNRYYIGMHSTDNLDDGYFGSGKRLWFSINYHGKDNHTKEILEFLPNRLILKEREKEIVNKELITDVLCMNLKEGGEGGFTSEEHRTKFIDGRNKTWTKEHRDKKVWLFKNDEKWAKNFGDIMRKNGLGNKSLTGKNHSEEAKEKISKSKKGTGSGKTNSQYGTCWITKNKENKKVKKEAVELYLNEGWIKGMYRSEEVRNKISQTLKNKNKN